MNVVDLTEAVPESLVGSPWRRWAGQAATVVAREVLGSIHPALLPAASGVVGATVRGGWLRLVRSHDVIAVGGPVDEPTLPEEWAHLELELPTALVALYRRAGGFGPEGEDGPWRDGLVAPERLAPLLARMRFGEEDILYDPAALLVLSSDGRGGAWCLRCDRTPPVVVHWDHTTHALSQPRSLDAWLRTLAGRW
jgi:hypothetical protein